MNMTWSLVLCGNFFMYSCIWLAGNLTFWPTWISPFLPALCRYFSLETVIHLLNLLKLNHFKNSRLKRETAYVANSLEHMVLSWLYFVMQSINSIISFIQTLSWLDVDLLLTWFLKAKGLFSRKTMYSGEIDLRPLALLIKSIDTFLIPIIFSKIETEKKENKHWSKFSVTR